MRTFLSSLLIALFAFAVPATADEPDYSATPDPSRIVLNPAANPATGQLVTWRTDDTITAGSVQYEPAAGGATTTTAAISGDPVKFTGWGYTSRHHSARLTGLSPDTKYRYRVGTEGHWSNWFTFQTAKADKSAWKMIYFGDAQNNLDTSWRPVVQQAFERTPDAKLSLHAGDLINNSANDVEWGQWFAGMEGPAQTVNQFTVTGNHEKSHDGLGIQFREHFATAGNGPVDADSTVYYTDYQDVRLIAIDGNGTALFEQEKFLKEALTNNPNKWTIVSFHQPIFSGARGRDNVVVRELLLPILKEHNVDLVLQGHDHVYARGMLTEDLDPKTGHGDGPVYVVSVAGPKYYELEPSDKNNWTDNAATRVAGFNETSTYQPITFDGNTLTYRSYIAAKGVNSSATGQVGDLLDSFTITKRKDGSKVVAEGETPPELPDEETPGVKPNLKVNKIAVNKKNGTAKLTVTANTAGKLKVTAPGIRTVNRNLKAGKKTTLQIKATPAKTRVLRRMGRLKVKVKLAFRAANGGKNVQVSRQVTLIGKKR